MLSGLRFETPVPPAAVAPERTDIACFIGYVARRPGVPLPDDLIAGLQARGWVGGPWGKAATLDPLDALEQLPVPFESWQSFSQLFAWELRPLREAGAGSCATYLGAAVRSFFANGGRRAWVIRVGDSFPYLENGGGRVARRCARIQRLVPGYTEAGLPGQPLDPLDPGTWRGIQHLCGLPEVSHLCLPDLPDLCAADPPRPPTAFVPPPAPEVFVECSADDPALPTDGGLRQIAAPRSDGDGYRAWCAALNQVRQFLGGNRNGAGPRNGQRRDVLLVGALPLPMADARNDDGSGIVHAEADLLAFLRRSGVLEAAPGAAIDDRIAASAFLQLTWPWLRSSRSDDLPQSLEPADGLLVGLLARNALERGTFRSVAGSVLGEVIGLTPLPAMGLGADSPTEQLAERICLIACEPEGMTLESDVTTSADIAWRFGGTSRLMAAILRAARRFG